MAVELSDNTTVAITINSDQIVISIMIVSKLLLSSKHHSLLLLAVELETVLLGYS